MHDPKTPSFAEIISIIENASNCEMNEIMLAIQRRYRKFYSDWEVLYIACPKNDPMERQRTMEFILNHFQQHT